jgi:hypothetical protein
MPTRERVCFRACVARLSGLSIDPTSLWRYKSRALFTRLYLFCLFSCSRSFDLFLPLPLPRCRVCFRGQVKPGDKAQQVRRLRRVSPAPFNGRANRAIGGFARWFGCFSGAFGGGAGQAGSNSSLRMSEALVSGAAGLPPRRLVVTPDSHRHIQRRNALIVAIPKERERERAKKRTRGRARACV